jgi:hypothetical protein
MTPPGGVGQRRCNRMPITLSRRPADSAGPGPRHPLGMQSPLGARRPTATASRHRPCAVRVVGRGPSGIVTCRYGTRSSAVSVTDPPADGRLLLLIGLNVSKPLCVSKRMTCKTTQSLGCNTGPVYHLGCWCRVRAQPQMTPAFLAWARAPRGSAGAAGKVLHPVLTLLR